MSEGGHNNGFSLIEVMVAMTILTVGILGMMVLQMKGVKNNSLSGSATTATLLAQLHMESIIHADYESPGISDVNISNNNRLKSSRNVDYQNIDVNGKGVHWGRFTLCWNVADDTPVKNTKTIVVTVSWENGRRSRQFTFIKSLVS